MLKIRYTRVGKKHAPVFRLVVTEHKNAVKGKFLEIVGFYNPVNKETKINQERILYWLNFGAKPSNSVARLLLDQKIKHKSIVFEKSKERKPRKEAKEEAPKSETKLEEIIPEENIAKTGDNVEAPAETGRVVEEVKEVTNKE